MPLNGLNHYSIRAADLDRTKNFYTDVLGLKDGYRPPLNFPGYWLYIGDAPIVHLLGPRPPEREVGLLPRKVGPTGLLDHIAFSCTGLAAMKDNLKKHGIEYEERVIPRDRQTQLFLHDPDGVAVELNYPPAETAAAA
jgi:catechol 2,3-dioxygenase-like lactoylglutathione lyase family enzyme